MQAARICRGTAAAVGRQAERLPQAAQPLADAAAAAAVAPALRLPGAPSRQPPLTRPLSPPPER
eukprot:scaffold3045_cov225-Prasinococcus_capsulatus_cf.AAC.4